MTKTDPVILHYYWPTGMMKRPLEDDEEDSSMKRARGDGPRIELRILLQSKVIQTIPIQIFIITMRNCLPMYFKLVYRNICIYW